MADPTWTNLIDWLERKHQFDASTLKVELRTQNGQRGLFAIEDIKPATRLISLPPSALLNSKTLRPLYPAALYKKLSAIQLITLHLALFRKAKLSSTAQDTLFVPFIQSLPSEDEHPLWLFLESEHEAMLQDTTKEYQRCMKDVCNRFRADLSVIQAEYTQYQSKPTQYALKKASLPLVLEEKDVIWAWLMVNTRSIYYNLQLDQADNLTMAPLIDMINHAFGSKALPCNEFNQFTFLSSLASDTTITSDEPLFRKGEEVCFPYGAHSNAKLLAEYGFILEQNPNDIIPQEDEIEWLFYQLDSDTRTLKTNHLVESGYDGGYCFHYSDGTPQAAYSLLVALRLYYAQVSEHATWRHLVTGYTTIVSKQNEARVKEQVAKMKDQALQEARNGLQRFDAAHSAPSSNTVKAMRSLWAKDVNMLENVQRECTA